MYLASEIDRYAIKVAQRNFPATIQLGDISKLSGYMDLFGERLFIMFGGSSCQGLSFLGKQLRFEDPRSKLFFEWVRLKREFDPVYFLFENVPTDKRSEAVISELLGVDPVVINSALVSAQNRKRLYWTNIPGVSQPAERGLLLKDILETDGLGVIRNRGLWYPRNDKAMCIDANYAKGADNHGQRSLIYLTAEQIEKAKSNYSGKKFATGKRRGFMAFPDSLDKKSKCLTTQNLATNRTTVHIESGGGDTQANSYRMRATANAPRQLYCRNPGYTSLQSNRQRLEH
jgi:site-specific DNA-cytosine methylase